MLKSQPDNSTPVPAVSDWNGYERYENYKAETNSQDFSSLIRQIEGQMLTIADASFVDQEQRRAVKSLIKNTLWGNTYEDIQKCLFQRSKGESYPLG